MAAASEMQSTLRSRIRIGGLIAGPVLALICLALLPDQYTNDAGEAVAFTFAGRGTMALLVWMAVWWLTEAIDISATALLPVVLLPLITIGEFDDATGAIAAAASPYAHHFIALFLGGFLLALSMERWHLHRRIALATLRVVGTRPLNMIAGFMGITAVMSMWVSNTATVVMMLPIAVSVIGLVEEQQGDELRRSEAGGKVESYFALCLLLGIAYSASVGGIGTLIGTPPNILLAGFIQENFDQEISFARWLAVGLPVVIVFLPIIFVLLTKVIYPVAIKQITGGKELIRDRYAALGRMSRGEWVTFIVFMCAAIAWITRPLLSQINIAGVQPLAGLTDSGVAMIAALTLFVIPVNLRKPEFVMNWEAASRVPWGILILFGGGLSLSSAVTRHGVAEFLGQQAAGLDVLPEVLIVVIIAAGIIFLTELTSNTATTATMLPILAGLAPSLGIHAFLLIVPAAIAASCAFMMPVATPPNAIVFGSGRISIPQMAKAGLWLNVIGVIIVTLMAYLVAIPLLT